MTESRPSDAPSAAPIVAGNLRVDALAAEVFRALDEADIEARLLKGAAVARWLYSSTDPRSYADCDLLVQPTQLNATRAVLERLGFVPEVDETAMPDWWREHAVSWLRDGDAAAVDVHRTLSGVAADDERAWAILSAAEDRIDIGGREIPTLSEPARTLHIALHAAQHGPEWGGTAAGDLERAVQRLDEGTWRQAAELARQLGAMPAFATGLRLSAAGAELADQLGLPAQRPADVALRARGTVPVALGFDQLARTEGIIAKLRVLARKLAPPPTFMRRWSPLAARSRTGLALAYVWRPLWLVLHAPRGLRAWLHARRS